VLPALPAPLPPQQAAPLPAVEAEAAAPPQQHHPVEEVVQELANRQRQGVQEIGQSASAPSSPARPPLPRLSPVSRSYGPGIGSSEAEARESLSSLWLGDAVRWQHATHAWCQLGTCWHVASGCSSRASFLPGARLCCSAALSRNNALAASCATCTPMPTARRSAVQELTSGVIPAFFQMRPEVLSEVRAQPGKACRGTIPRAPKGTIQACTPGCHVSQARTSAVPASCAGLE